MTRKGAKKMTKRVRDLESEIDCNGMLRREMRDRAEKLDVVCTTMRLLAEDTPIKKAPSHIAESVKRIQERFGALRRELLERAEAHEDAAYWAEQHWGPNGVVGTPCEALKAKLEASRSAGACLDEGCDAVSRLCIERDNAIAHRNGLYRVMRHLAEGNYGELSQVDEMIQADVDTVIGKLRGLTQNGTP